MSRTCNQFGHGLSKDHFIIKLRSTNALVQEGARRSEFRSIRKPMKAAEQNMTIHHPRLLNKFIQCTLEVAKTNLPDNTSPNIY